MFYNLNTFEKNDVLFKHFVEVLILQYSSWQTTDARIGQASYSNGVVLLFVLFYTQKHSTLYLSLHQNFILPYISCVHQLFITGNNP